MKYIDAEKLIHDLEERIYAYSEGYANGDDYRKDAIETLLKDVKYQLSLQQEQPIDKNILTWRDVNELERVINKVHYEFPHGIGEEAFGKLVLERFIDGKDDVQE